MSKRMTPEGAVKKEVMEGLKKMGYKVFRMNSGVAKVRGGFMHLCPNGTPDLIFFHQGCPVWCEIKSVEGKRSRDQIEFESWAHQQGHKYVCAMAISDVLAVL